MGISFSVFQGCANAIRDLSKIEAFSPNEFARALKEEIQIEVKECKAVCPKDKGDLEKSIHATEPVREGRRISMAIVAGEPGSGAEDYALIQHEDLEFFHPVGGPKYIENPLKESAPSLPDRIAKRIDLNKAL